MIYYTPPSDQCFDELKEKAMELWHEVDTDNDKYGYATEKCNRIKDIKNVSDNFMYIVRMFDTHNQRILAIKLSPDTSNQVYIRFAEGGMPSEFNPFLKL